MGADETGGGGGDRDGWHAIGLIPESTSIGDYGSHLAKSLVNNNESNDLTDLDTEDEDVPEEEGVTVEESE